MLGEIAERTPGLVEKIVEEGHEVACHGYTHNSMKDLGRQQFEDQNRKAKEVIRSILGYEPLGYRSPNLRISTEEINVLDNLGFRYDSSVTPCLKIPGWYGYPSAAITPYRPSMMDLCKKDSSRDFWEVPIAVFPTLRLPGGGGWYLRNFGGLWTKTVVKMLLKKGPATVYLHPWEISGNHRNYEGVPFHVFRRTGRYVRDAIKSIIRDVGVRPMTIGEFYHKECC